jgi:hypothetical protein
MTVVLHMAMTFIITILMAQLWLFTVALEAMETHEAPAGVVFTALVVSMVGCVGVWWLIRVFLRAEQS